MATFNILHGRSVDDAEVDVDPLADCVRRLDADVLALQEVDCEQPRSAMADLTAVAAEAMGAVSQRFVAAISLLSRFEARTWQVVRLPRIPGKFPMYLPGPRRVQVVDQEPRPAVLARFDTDVGPLTVANTHRSFVPGWNRVQLRRLTRDLRGFPRPRVLMGDLNMSPPTPQRWTRMRPLGAALTFPVGSPDRQLDHILTDDTGLVTYVCSAPTLPVSDHRPLIIDVSRR